MNELTDMDILALKTGGLVIKEMSAITFLKWVSEKLNGVKAYSAASTELTLMIQNAPFGRMMGDEQKIDVVRKLIKCGVTLP